MAAITMHSATTETLRDDEREQALRWLDTQLRWESRLGRYRSREDRTQG